MEINFSVSHPDQFGPAKRLCSCSFLLIFSAQCLSPDCIGYFPLTLSVYLTCHFFSSLFLCLNSPAPMYLPVTSVLSIFLHMKPFDLTYIGRPTSFAYIKQERSRQHATGSVSINIFEYFALSAADEQEFPVYSCLICLITNA